MRIAEFSTWDIIKALCINRNCLQEWIRLGVVRPTIRARGTGTRNRFTFDDVVKVNVFRHLVAIGIQRVHASALVASIVDTDSTASHEISKDVSIHINVRNIKNETEDLVRVLT